MDNHNHLTGDPVLSHLAMETGDIGTLVRAYPGHLNSSADSWLDDWFRERIEKHFRGEISGTLSHAAPPQPLVSGELSLVPPVRLVSVQPHYFRGFREVAQAIRFDSALVVVYGGNSTGKTSLAEAIEWLFTGSLSRWQSGEHGNARELENCVGNQFRPDCEHTCVAATFERGSGEDSTTLVLHRRLIDDYGAASTSLCTSTLSVDSRELTKEEEARVCDELFASVAPLLMQHTLRQFVHSTPDQRRGYFERLLQLDQLTDLIGRAVVGNARLLDFPSPSASKGLQLWTSLGSLVTTESSKRALRTSLTAKAEDYTTTVRTALVAIAKSEFPSVVTGSTGLEDIHSALAREQQTARQQSFPLLQQLRPKRQIADDTLRRAENRALPTICSKVQETWDHFIEARDVAQAIGPQRLSVAQTLNLLLAEKLIHADQQEQTCPLCAHEGEPTLTLHRIREIASWIPAQEKEAMARDAFLKAVAELQVLVRGAIDEHDAYCPPRPSEKEWETALVNTEPEVRNAAISFRKQADHGHEALRSAVLSGITLIKQPVTIPTVGDDCTQLIKLYSDILADLDILPTAAIQYRDAFRNLESAVGAAASVDPQYRLRAGWIECSSNVAAISADQRWERAKLSAQKDLERIRSGLIAYRQNILESRRSAFNESIQNIWSTLRSDRYSSFSQLNIPIPKGKGFPIAIEVKALLDDGRSQREVDALQVFSESQIHALGIAAFVTRSKMIGHKVLIFDDPVQSMDEDHFRTFALDVLTYFRGEGFQVIILTHNELFERDVSHAHFDRLDYATMTVRHSRRTGTVVEEGNRRVPERLKQAEKYADDGRFDDAWKVVRLALERLYTVVYIKYGPANFDPHGWRDATAEYMWGYVGDLITARDPMSTTRLKDILTMTAAGAHDKVPKGETDLRLAIQYLRSLVGTLRIGG